MRRFRGKRSALDLVVVFSGSDFVASTVNCALWTCGSFSEFGRISHEGGSLEALLLRNALAEPRDVNRDVQIVAGTGLCEP